MALDSNGETSTKRNVAVNENEKKDMDLTIQYTRILLKCLGVWPYMKKNPRWPEMLLSKVLIVTCSLLLLFIAIPCAAHAIMREKRLSVKMKLLGPIGLRVFNLLKYYAIIYRCNVIKLCIEHVEKDWRMATTESDREIMTRNALLGRRITIICIVFMYSGGMSYNMIMPLWRGNKLIAASNGTTRPLVFPGYDIFVDPQSSPEYEIIFYSTCLSALVTYSIITVVCSLAAIFVTHACGQIQIIISRLGSLFDNVDDQSDLLTKRISVIIRCHVRVLRLQIILNTFRGSLLKMYRQNRRKAILDGNKTKRNEENREEFSLHSNDANSSIIFYVAVVFSFAQLLRFEGLTERIEEALSDICLLEIILTTGLICLVEYYCVTEWGRSDNVAIFTYALLFVSFSFNIFIFCHIGELQQEQCSAVGKSTYMIDWYRLPGKTGQALILVIAMSNYPRKFTAGGMMELSIASFGAIIKTSVMYCNIARAMEN